MLILLNNVYCVTGILHSAINDTPTANIISSNVNLTVMIINNPITNYLHELNWYYNGQKINTNSDIHYNILNNNKTLIISNISQDYLGAYSVQFDGLILYPYNRNCELKALQSLRNYPVLSPVVFNVSLNGKFHYNIY